MEGEERDLIKGRGERVGESREKGKQRGVGLSAMMRYEIHSLLTAPVTLC